MKNAALQAERHQHLAGLEKQPVSAGTERHAHEFPCKKF
jgi:hypothetical protein